MMYKGHAKQNTKKELKETLNWTSSTEISSTGRTDAIGIGASDGCRMNRRPGYWHKSVRLWRSCEDQVKHRLNRRLQDRHRCIQRTMFQRRCQARRSQVFSTG